MIARATAIATPAVTVTGIATPAVTATGIATPAGTATGIAIPTGGVTVLETARVTALVIAIAIGISTYQQPKP